MTRFKLPEIIYLVAPSFAQAKAVAQAKRLRRDDWILVSTRERIMGLPKNIRVFLIDWPDDTFKDWFEAEGFKVEYHVMEKP